MNVPIKMDKRVQQIYNNAHHAALMMGSNSIGSEHLLLGICEEGNSEFAHFLLNQGLDIDKLYDECRILFGEEEGQDEPLKNTKAVDEILEKAMENAKNKNVRRIDEQSLIQALLSNERCVAFELLKRYDIDYAKFNQQHCELDQLSELKNLNLENANPMVSGRDEEIAQMIRVLCRKEKANPLLVGEAGVGKSAIVEKLASMIEKKEVPEPLLGTVIYELNLNTLVSGTKYRGDFEEKVERLLKKVGKYPNVILFIDEVHQIIGAGKAEGSIDVASVLKPALARGKYRFIGATTLKEYEMYLLNDRALVRRFQKIMIEEPSEERTCVMLENKLKEYGDYHKVQICEGILPQIVSLSQIYMPQNRLPDKCFDILDLACVNAAFQNNEVNTAMVELAVEQLAHIPLFNKEKLMQLNEKLTFPQKEKVIQVLSERGKKSSKKPTLILSQLSDKTILQQLGREVFHQERVLEIDCSNFDISCEFALQKIREQPFSLVHILNIQDATFAMRKLLLNLFENGILNLYHYETNCSHVFFFIDIPTEEKGIFHMNRQSEELFQPLLACSDVILRN